MNKTREETVLENGRGELMEPEGFGRMLGHLKRTASANKVAHYTAAWRHRILHYTLGVISIVLSVFVGGALFITLQTDFGFNMRLALASLG